MPTPDTEGHGAAQSVCRALSVSRRGRQLFRNVARTHHFALHVVIELDPSFFHLWSKCSAKLLFQAPYQRLAKRSEMQRLRPELCVTRSDGTGRVMVAMWACRWAKRLRSEKVASNAFLGSNEAT